MSARQKFRLQRILTVYHSFCIPNINAVINTPTDQPILQVIYNITGSYAAACVLGSVLVVIVFIATLTNIAAASRQTWAFARDGGFPFSKWIMRVDPKYKTPLNALWVTAAVSYALGAINFGSWIAFDAIVAISNAALIFSYLMSVGCIRLKRFRESGLRHGRWSMGRFGGIVNDFSIAFLIVSFVFSFFPEAPIVGDPTWAADFNWAIVMFGATCFIATAYYLAGGRNVYVPPVRLVKNE